MFQRNSSHVLRIWKVKRGTGFIVTSGEEGQDDEELKSEDADVSSSASEGESNAVSSNRSVVLKVILRDLIFINVSYNM